MKKTLLILIIIFLIFLLIFPIIKPKTNKNNNYWEDIKTRIPYYKEDNLSILKEVDIIEDIGYSERRYRHTDFVFD